MSLTYGHGPFGQRPGGEFNFTRNGPDAALYWEDFPKRVRVEFNGGTLADSRRVKALHETGIAARYYLPPEDVRTELLKRSETVSQCPYKGDGQHWNLTVEENTVRDVAWTLPNPLGEAEVIAGYCCFYPTKVEVEVDGERLVE